MEKSEFIKSIEQAGVKTVLKETTPNCYPGRLYAKNSIGLVGYWSPGTGYQIFNAPLKRFDTNKRTFDKIKIKDL